MRYWIRQEDAWVNEDLARRFFDVLQFPLYTLRKDPGLAFKPYVPAPPQSSFRLLLSNIFDPLKYF